MQHHLDIQKSLSAGRRSNEVDNDPKGGYFGQLGPAKLQHHSALRDENSDSWWGFNSDAQLRKRPYPSFE